MLMARRRKNLHVLGELSNEKVLAYIQAADVFILPSRDEALPMSLLEAMYFSKGIIASRSGGIPEIIEHGENGLIFELEDYQQLADYIQKLFYDREYLEQMGRRGYEKLRADLTFEVQGYKWIGIIEEQLQQSKSRGVVKEKYHYVN
jgi:glycosyltransferase involved in cell wall biosynthesis